MEMTDINSSKSDSCDSVNQSDRLTLEVDASDKLASTSLLAGIGPRIKHARGRLGLTQQELADAVGGSKSGIQDNEAGKSTPRRKVLAGLERLGVNPSWLLTGDGEMLLQDRLAPAVATQLHQVQTAQGGQCQVMGSSTPAAAPAGVVATLDVASLAALVMAARAMLGAAGTAFAIGGLAVDLYLQGVSKTQSNPLVINGPALASIIQGILEARGVGAAPDTVAQLAARFYQEALQERQITSSGVGDGGVRSA